MFTMLPLLADDGATRAPARASADWLETALGFAPMVTTVLVVTGILFASRWMLERGKDRSTFRNQLVLLLLSLAGLIAFVLSLPVPGAERNQLLALLGLVLSAGIALSSTSFLGNLFAGFMLRAIRNFRTGDFLRVEQSFGRVSERGLFHTEIQTEERNLITLPNLYLVSHPVTVLRSSGTIISATVSLGYDAPRNRIEETLLAAGTETGLVDSFVSVVELGNYSVNYRIAGLLVEVKHIVSARSNLRKAVLDALHHAGIEIVSPTFLNLRSLKSGELVIPHELSGPHPDTPVAQPKPEALMFDKADEAERLERRRKLLEELEKRIAEARKKGEKGADEGREARQQRVERLEARRAVLQTEIEARERFVQDLDD